MVVQQKIDELLALRASEWVELLPTASPAQLGELESWLSESKLHVQEFLEVAEVEFALGGLDRHHKEDVDTLLQKISSNVVTFRQRPAALGATGGPARQRNWKMVALAASWAVLALVATLTFWKPATSKQQYATHVGEHRVIQLADRSTVTLNADSRIDVVLEESARNVELVQGEATFQVARDTKRPFRVRTRAGVVEVVGTQFDVRQRTNGDTRVAVLEGRVRLESPSRELTLEAGEEADIHADGTIKRRADTDASDAIAWQKNQLVFENASLVEMVTEFNRQNRSLRLRLEGIEGSAHHYDGVFDATDPAAFAQFLAHEPGLTVERRGNEILIRAQGQP